MSYSESTSINDIDVNVNGKHQYQSVPMGCPDADYPNRNVNRPDLIDINLTHEPYTWGYVGASHGHATLVWGNSRRSTTCHTKVSKFCLLFKLIFLHSFMSDLHDLHCLSVSIICSTFYHDEDAGTKVSWSQPFLPPLCFSSLPNSLFLLRELVPYGLSLASPTP